MIEVEVDVSKSVVEWKKGARMGRAWRPLQVLGEENVRRA